MRPSLICLDGSRYVGYSVAQRAMQQFPCYSMSSTHTVGPVICHAAIYREPDKKHKQKWCKLYRPLALFSGGVIVQLRSDPEARNCILSLCMDLIWLLAFCLRFIRCLHSHLPPALAAMPGRRYCWMLKLFSALKVRLKSQTEKVSLESLKVSVLT